MSVLDRRVLVLNKNWHAIRVIPAFRALALVFREHAEILDHEQPGYPTYDWAGWEALPAKEGQDVIKTTRQNVRLPRVIRLTGYDRVPLRRPKLNRRNVYERDGGRCQYTGRKLPFSESTLDHVKPRSRGGRHEWPNVVLASREVNHRKGNRLNSEAGLRLLKEPTQPAADPVEYIRSLPNLDECWLPFLSKHK